jgi:hypothetical protein
VRSSRERRRREEKSCAFALVSDPPQHRGDDDAVERQDDREIGAAHRGPRTIIFSAAACVERGIVNRDAVGIDELGAGQQRIGVNGGLA